MNYVGIDHHRQYSHMTLMDQEGQVLRSGRVPNLRAEIEKFLEGGEAMEAVIETGRSSTTMVDVLRSESHRQSEDQDGQTGLRGSGPSFTDEHDPGGVSALDREPASAAGLAAEGFLCERDDGAEGSVILIPIHSTHFNSI